MITQIGVGCFISYFLGSIPFSYLIARKIKGVDLRVEGEGNVGARNVWHVVGKKYGILAALLDFSKGLVSYGVSIWLGLSPWWIWLCGIFVVLGHGFPVFLRGKGGKGAACAFGFLLGMQPFLILFSGALIGILYFSTRNFHIAVGIGMGSVPVLWKFYLHKSWLETGVLTSFLIILGLKRLIDEPYMRKIKQSSGW